MLTQISVSFTEDNFVIFAIESSAFLIFVLKLHRKKKNSIFLICKIYSSKNKYNAGKQYDNFYFFSNSFIADCHYLYHDVPAHAGQKSKG